MILFYKLFLYLYPAGVRLASLVNPKAKLWLRGRRHVFWEVRSLQRLPGQKLVWMHSASLGEFEQGKPVLTRLQQAYPDAKFVITFFSPSGYEIIRRKNEFEHIYYLPMDGRGNARKWVRTLRPDLVLWIKYDYWYYYLMELSRRRIPVLLVSAVFRRDSLFFKWHGQLHRKMLECFTHVFVQNKLSARLLSRLIRTNKITISGDTRCDRVMETYRRFTPIPQIEAFCNGYLTVVAGSTWAADEQVWTHYIQQHPQYRFILAPHVIDPENLDRIQKLLPESVLYTNWIKDTTSSTNCLIINNIGMLSRLYKYADICYVGGGFGDSGLHNILEPAVFGRPVLFGPVFDKNFEAQELIDSGGALSVQTALELEEAVDALMGDVTEREKRGRASATYVRERAGASESIVSWIEAKSILS